MVFHFTIGGRPEAGERRIMAQPDAESYGHAGHCGSRHGNRHHHGGGIDRNHGIHRHLFPGIRKGTVVVKVDPDTEFCCRRAGIRGGHRHI